MAGYHWPSRNLTNIGALPLAFSSEGIIRIKPMENEAASLDHEFKTIEHDYGADYLKLVLTTGYLTRLLSTARGVRYLAQKFPDILADFQKITEQRKAA
ncbi:hypothetical protein LPJGGPFB_04922 [Ensifer adhaerens]|uniref:plasmid partitioning protein RepB C-terminal domain-containing protein n=1 Tax=Ensifer adhaerens TaxID=106592 RepID=UPI001568BD20|nr:plasmid partitioning protein RepB C-terminal domain-containing protein [Ensifer adhaerens]NRP21663.1 hypothetical protein [Ensifer adhaerens]